MASGNRVYSLSTMASGTERYCNQAYCLSANLFLLFRRSTSGSELIPFSTTTTGSSSTQSQVLANPGVGTEVPWAMTPDTTNTYAAGAVVTANKYEQ
ncbi:hypothetical protein DPMN_194237 [Dreissena polymorpha]|uniref:Uncharacterized protein n=1 Tax=Dreissena polymorpha TaxID=45954 RepID=A0A9D3Y2D3_DREPO|nr:hypothetical protein DPMN_194237 [Dreissena polymorpha]